MDLNFRDLTDRSDEELAELFNRGFENYFVDFKFDANTYRERTRVEGVDPRRSRIVERDGVPCGIAWIVPRKTQSRLAAMGIVVEARRTGVGRALLHALLSESEAAGEERMVLEVIRKNEGAIRLYESHGFRRDARLLGFRAEAPAGRDGQLEEIEASEVAEAMGRVDDGSFPWQMSAPNLARTVGVGFRLGAARALVSEGVAMRIHAVVTRSDRQRHGEATRLLQALFARWPARTWNVPVIVPEGPGTELFRSLGFEALKLEQLQMVRDATP